MMDIQKFPSPGMPNTRILDVRGSKSGNFYRWILYAGVGLSPFLNLRSEYAFFTVSDALILFCFVTLLLTSRIQTDVLGIANYFWLCSYYLLIFGLFISSLLYGDVIRGAILALQYSFCFIVLPFVLMREANRHIVSMIVAYVVGVVVLDLHGISAFFMNGYVPGSLTVTGGHRLATLTGDPNSAACLNAMTIVVTMCLGATGRLKRITALFFVSVMVLTTVLTSSNSGLMALGAGLGCYLLLTLSVRSFLSALTLVAFVATVGYFGGAELLPATFQKRVMLAVSSGKISEAGTFESRRKLMVEAANMIDEKKVGLLGIGADQYRKLSAYKAPVHNTYLIVWVEGGLIALVGWLGLFVTGFLVWHAARINNTMRNERAAMISCFLIFATISVTLPHIYARYWYILLTLLLGLILHDRPELMCRRLPQLRVGLGKNGTDQHSIPIPSRFRNS
jgi:O-antigen ligase